MEDSVDCSDALLRLAARRLTGRQRCLFVAEVALRLCDGSPRRAERRFHWGRVTVTKGLRELQRGIQCLDNFQGRGRPRLEDKNPQLAEDIRELAEPKTHADPELKSDRRYANLSAGEMLTLLQTKKGYTQEALPSVRTMRDIMNRLGYRLKRIQKAKPLKKTKQTDAIFANVQAVRAEVKDDPETLEISADTKAKVNEGDYARGGKNPDRRERAHGKRLGPRSAGQTEMGAAGHLAVADGRVDTVLRLQGDE
jgi:transposase